MDQLSRHLGVYPGSLSVADDVELPTPSEKALEQARAARNSALEAAVASQQATAAAVLELTAEGLSLRDCGYLLGISHGRVRQILQSAPRRRNAKPKKSTKLKKTGD